MSQVKPHSQLVFGSRLLRLLICSLVVGLTAKSALALDPTKAITEFIHTSWTEKDGIPSEVRALAQTPDGYLWLGTSTGLYHFDGVQFARYEPLAGDALPATRIRRLLTSRDGSLWIVWASGTVNHVSSGHSTAYSEQDGLPLTNCLAEAGDGTLIAATVKGLSRFKDGAWKDVGTEWGFGNTLAKLNYFDKAGALWVLIEGRVLYLPAGQSHFIDPSEPAGESTQFMESPDGVMWLSETIRSAHTVRRLADRAQMTEVGNGPGTLLFDRNGSLWIGSMGEGLRRIAYPNRISGQKIAMFGGAEQFTTKDGLSGAFVRSSLEDREGNLWFGTDKGLDRFRPSLFTVVPLPRPDIPRLVLATRDGSVVTATQNGVEVHRIYPQRPPKVILKAGSAYAMCEDEAGSVWTIIFDYLYRYDHGPLVDVVLGSVLNGGVLRNHFVSIACDQPEGILLVDTEQGLLRFAGGKLTRITELQKMPFGWTSLYVDRVGRIWVGESGRIEVYDHGQSKLFSNTDGVPAGTIWAFREDQAGHLWIGSDGGVVRFEDHRFRTISPATGLPAGAVYDLIQDDGGSWWMASDRGVLRVPAGELDRAVADSGYRLHYEIFNLLDGLPGRPHPPGPGPVLARTTDGRIWFSTDNGVAYIDPGQIPKNDLPPPVHVEAITANGVHYPSVDSLQLPARIANLQIQYTALSLTIPERVRFRYMLEGVDPDWQDPGTRRIAYYTNLRPGNYRFRVNACNNDGLWNEVGATLKFRITPAWYQTIWFNTLVVVCALSIIWLLFRLRVQQVSRAIKTRFDERLAERTRIARELHDTLLQTVQGSKLVADDALDKPDDMAHLLSAMRRLSSWLGQATQEGRAALNSLRTSTIETNDLAAALRRALAECLLDNSLDVEFLVTDGPSDIHPIARDEIYRIGYEAIRNACEHSSATRLEISLNYAQDLTLRVQDNGIGMEATVLTEGRAGHFGLQGMRERAERIRSKLTLVSSPGSGTEITLVVPGIVIYRKPGTTHFDKLKFIFGQTRHQG